MGLAPPLGGVLARWAGLDAVYLAAAVAALGAAAVAFRLLRSGPAPEAQLQASPERS